MSKQTPGPWKVRERYDGEFDIVSDGLDEKGNKGWTVCTTANCFDLDERKRSNADIIAMAPDMLKAIEEAAPWESCSDYAEGCHKDCNDTQCGPLVEVLETMNSHSS